MSFFKLLELHLDSIRRKDLPAFVSTLTRHERLTLILLSGKMLSTRSAFVELHEAWFQDSDWSIDFKIIQCAVGTDMAFALLEVSYDDVDAKGAPFSSSYFLNLIFQREEGSWALIFDQNSAKEALPGSGASRA